MRALLICWLLMIGSIAQAQEQIQIIEVFLKQGMEISGTEQAHKVGHSITYYYLDATQTLEQELSKVFTHALKRQLENAEQDSDITRQIIDQFNDRSNPDTAIKLKSIVTENIKSKLAKAWRDVVYAKGLLIKPEDLPVVRFKSINHNRLTELSRLFEEVN